MISTDLVWGKDINLPDGTLVAEAYRYSSKFLEEFCRMESQSFQLAPGCPPPGCTPNRIIEFLESNGLRFVPITIDENDYASWLMPMEPIDPARGDPFVYIAIDFDQIERWFKDTGMPEDIQICRIMIHEFAHKLFDERLITSGHRFDGRQGAEHSTPLEENRAWVFAYFFFSLIMGEYSLISRKRVGVDNTPARFC